MLRTLARDDPTLRQSLWLLAVLAAFNPGNGAGEESQDSALTALERGQIVPLEEILKLTEVQGLGQILEIELERHKGRWVYEIEGLSANGLISHHYFDAATKARLADAPNEFDEREH